MFAGRPCLADVNDLTNFFSSPHSFNKPADTENKRGSSEVRGPRPILHLFRLPSFIAPLSPSPSSLYIIPPFFFRSFTLCRLSPILFSLQTPNTLTLTDLWKCSGKISKHRALRFLFLFPLSPWRRRNISRRDYKFHFIRNNKQKQQRRYSV